MTIRVNRVPTAFKHGLYSSTTVLPGEDPEAFEKLHRDLITEFNPNGPFESDIVANMARLLWRKQNLKTFRIAERARNRYARITAEIPPSDSIGRSIARWAAIYEANAESAEDKRVARIAEAQARKELGDTYDFIENREIATFDALSKELALDEQLNIAIEKCLKRFLMVKGVKSISASSASPPQLRNCGPSKAA